MNTEQLKGDWMILKGKIKEQWGKLTDDDLKVADGQLDQLAGRMAVRYGITKEEAEKRLNELCNSCCSK